MAGEGSQSPDDGDNSEASPKFSRTPQPQGCGIALKNTAVPPTPSTVELLAYCGIRPCGIRLGLYPLDIPLIENMARVAELAGVTTLVKFGELDTVTMWDVLDSVAKGTLMPGLKNAAEVKADG